MKHVVPFYPVVCQTPREDFFRVGKDVGGGEIISVNKNSFSTILGKIHGEFVHAHGRGFPFPEVSSIFAKKAVYSPHNDTIGSNPVTSLARRKVFNKYAAIVCQTEFGKKSLSSSGIDENKIHVIPNPVDYKFFSKPKGGKRFRRRFGFENNEPFAIAVGIRPIKNPEIIIKACELAGIRVALVGPINEKEVEKTWHSREFNWYLPTQELLQNRTAVFTGQLAAHELLQAFDSATVFINSSRYENFGLAVYEAASAGLPLCLPNYGTFGVFKSCALFHNFKNPQSLSDNLKKYLSNLNLRKKNEITSKQIAKLANYKGVREKLKMLYESLSFVV